MLWPVPLPASSQLHSTHGVDSLAHLAYSANKRSVLRRAPEVCSSSPYTSQADMWSLGCVLYELCTLEHAFAADSLYALIFRIINGSYTPIDQARYSASLSSLVASLLDKDPARRPSCRALLGSQFIQLHIEKTMNKVLMLPAQFAQFISAFASHWDVAT